MDLYSNYKYTIDSSVCGPYDTSTNVGQGANVAYNVLKGQKNGSIFGKNVQYSNGTNDFIFGYSTEMLKSQDSTGDCKITAKDQKWQNLANYYTDVYNHMSDKSNFDQSLLTDGKVDAQKVFDKFDINDDGEYDAAENAAYKKLQDSLAEDERFNKSGYAGTANDGVLTYDEAVMGRTYMFAKAESGDKLAQIYNENKLGEKYNLFKQNGTTGEDTETSTDDSSSITDSQYAEAGTTEADMVSNMDNPDNVIYAVKKDNDKWSKDYTNSYSKGIVDSLDSTGDGKVNADDDIFKYALTGCGEDAAEVLEKFDVNGNGEYDAEDNTALATLQDNTTQIFGNVYGVANDGILSSDEIKAGIQYVKYSENGKEALKKAYENNMGLSNSES